MYSKTRHDVITNFIIEYRESSYRLAYSYVKDKDEALDIVQDAICKALSNENSLKDLSSVKPWFFRIVVNTSIDFLRKNKRTLYVEDETLEAIGGSEEDAYEDMDLKEAIDHLPTRDKTLIQLRFYEGMKIEEIAIAMNENINTIKTRLYASLKKLRIHLEHEM